MWIQKKGKGRVVTLWTAMTKHGMSMKRAILLRRIAQIWEKAAATLNKQGRLYFFGEI